jgi:signal transduction histidine kinase
MACLRDARSGASLSASAIRNAAAAPRRVHLFHSLGCIFVWALAILAQPVSVRAQPLPRSVLILDQSDADSIWYDGFSAAFRSVLNAGSGARVSVYSEHLDFSRFSGPRYEEVLRTYLRDKFSATPIGVVVAQGSSALEFLVRRRAELWPNVPVVFAAVDEAATARLRLPASVTGATYRLTFRDAVASARMLVPTLKRIALVGDPFERQAVRGHFKEEIPVVAAELEVIDLMGLPMAELRKRVAALPDDTAIIYTAINVDGGGVTYAPHEALAAFADAANRPIVIDAETSLGYGGSGGLIVSAAPVGAEAAQRVLRILGGESASAIPVTQANFTRPIFDARQLQRFSISPSSLPAGSDIRFRPPGLWEQYRRQVIWTAVALLAQAAIITLLLVERHRRRRAELESRSRLLEVIHLNRTATAGAMSASISHELNQPLAAILLNVDTVEILLAADPPDLDRVKTILGHIRESDQHAAEIILRLRKLLKRSEIEFQEFDLNDAIAGAVHILSPEATRRGVALSTNGIARSLPVRADQVHLQQVILNLATNGMDAMCDTDPDRRRMSIQTAVTRESEVEVSVTDSGTGIPHEKLGAVFETFYTTKQQGTGLGLSIARTIVETYGGRIWAENRIGGGAVFRFTLPLCVLRPA